MWPRESWACGPRVVEGECSWTLPSGCPTTYLEWVCQEGPRQRVFWETCCISGGMLVRPRWQTNVFIGSVTVLAGTLANGSVFWESRRGDQPLPQAMWAFLLSFVIYFNYYLRGLGSLTLIFFHLLFNCPKRKSQPCFSTYWLRSSARVLFCAFSWNETTC